MTAELLDWLFIGFFFVFGICWGSFLNVWIFRIPLGRSVAGGRSGCMSCEHQLHAKDLVPVFSFLFLGAKCRYCKTKLSWQYPMVELLVGVLFAVSYVLVGMNPFLLFIAFVLITLNVVMAKIDIDKTLIPNVLSYSGMVLAVLIVAVNQYGQDYVSLVPDHWFSDARMAWNGIYAFIPLPSLTLSLVSGGLTFFALGVLSILTKGGVGMGDVKWATFIALLFGITVAIYVLIIANLMTVLYVAIVWLLKRDRLKALHNVEIDMAAEEEAIESKDEKYLGISKVNGKYAVVLGPFLATGMLLFFLTFAMIVHWLAA